MVDGSGPLPPPGVYYVEEGRSVPIWLLVEHNDEGSFEFRGSAGCNTVESAATTRSGDLVLDSVATTEQACQGDYDPTELRDFGTQVRLTDRGFTAGDTQVAFHATGQTR